MGLVQAAGRFFRKRNVGRSRSPWWVEVAVFVLFTVVAFAMLFPLPLHVRTHGVDFGWDDTYINTHFMRVFQDWLLGLRPGHRALDADFFYPHTLTLTTNDACLGLSVMLLPLRAVTDDYLAMMNIGLLVSFPLSAHAVYLFVRDGSGKPLEQDSTVNGYLRRCAGIVAGILFGFSAYRFHQLDHPGLEQMQWLPYLAWALLHTSRAPDPRRLFALVPFLFQALFASSNLAIYALPAIVFIGLFFLVISPEKKRYLAVCSAAAVIVAVPLVPIYLEHFEGVHNYTITRGLGEIQGFSAKPEQFFAVPKFLALWGRHFGDKLGWESATFLTVTALALAPFAFLGAGGAGKRRIAQALLVPPAIVGAGVIGIVHPIPAILLGIPALAFAVFAYRQQTKDPALLLAWFLTALAVTYAVFSVGPRVSWGDRSYLGPWAALMRLPGFASVRTPSRFWFVVTFAVASLAGIGLVHLAGAVDQAVRRLQGSLGRPLQQFAAIALLFVAATTAILETRPAGVPVRRLTARNELPPVYQWLRDQAPEGPVLELPRFDARRERSRLYFSNFHKHPGVAGESGILLPSAARFFNEVIRDGNLHAKFEEMQAVGVRIVTIDSGAWGASNEHLVTAALTVLGATRGPSFGAVETYLLPPAVAPRPFSWTDPDVVTRLRFDAAPTDRVSLLVGNLSDQVLYSAPNGPTRGVFEATLAGTVRKTPTSRIKTFSIPLIAAPILIAGRSVQRLEGHFPLTIGELPEGAEITYTLRLGDGPATAPKTFTLLPPADPRLPCTLRRIAGGRGKTGLYRQLLEVETPNAHEHGLASVETDGPQEEGASAREFADGRERTGPEDRPALPRRDSTGFPLAQCEW